MQFNDVVIGVYSITCNNAPLHELFINSDKQICINSIYVECNLPMIAIQNNQMIGYLNELQRSTSDESDATNINETKLRTSFLCSCKQQICSYLDITLQSVNFTSLFDNVLLGSTFRPNVDEYNYTSYKYLS